MSTLPADIAVNPILSRWIGIAGDGAIEVRAGKVELGQGVWTSQMQIAADELDVPLESIRLCVGNTDQCPDQGLTAGSLSTEVGGMALRQVCAEVRQLFVNAAAQRLGVHASEVTIDEGVLSAGAGVQGLRYADLAAYVNLDCLATGTALPKPPSARRIAGVSVQRPDLPRKLSGAAYIQDLDLPGQLHGRMVRPPSSGAAFAGFDEDALHTIQNMPGFHTLLVNGRYIGVCAEREEQAVAAALALARAARWDGTASLPAPASASAPGQAWLRTLPTEDSLVNELAVTPDDLAGNNVGPVVKRFAADYSRPFLAHASIGPSCGLARWEYKAEQEAKSKAKPEAKSDAEHASEHETLTVWTHAQGSFSLRRELAELFGIAIEQVTVIHADGAGCYGHNGADDAAIDAAMLARAAGRPVRLLWSREEEFAWSPQGSAMSVHIAAGLDETGRIAHWHQRTWSQSHVQRPGIMPGLNCLAGTHRTPAAPNLPARDFPLAGGGGGARNAVPLYDLPARRIEYHLIRAPVLRSSALRALGAYANVFAIESCMDELALLCGQDPIAFRLAHLSDLRAADVLKALAQDCGWHRPRAPASGDETVRGRGVGFARYKNSGAYCAVAIEIEVSDRIVLDRIWTVVDAGEVINPDGVVNQMEGGILQAASWTLKEALQWDESGVTTRSWDGYPILRFDETPRQLEVRLMTQPALPPLGVGECAAGPTAAAIANALADALGIRVRDLPLTPERLERAVQAG